MKLTLRQHLSDWLADRDLPPRSPIVTRRTHERKMHEAEMTGFEIGRNYERDRSHV